VISFILFLNSAIAADSTVVAPVSTAPEALGSYTLYQSDIIYQPSSGTVVSGSIQLSSACWPGYAACVYLETVDSNNLYVKDCEFGRVFNESSITRNSNGYKIDYKYGYNIVALPFYSFCAFKGGNFTLNVMCIRKESVDSNAYAGANGSGQVCTP
jgi:hypothetical protein